MRKIFVLAEAITLLCFGTAGQAVVIETVAVGDPGNHGELSGAGAGPGGYGPDRICGSVNYNYNIGKYEVTARQYTAFLNSKARYGDPYGLYNTAMGDPFGSLGCNIQRSGKGTATDPYSYSVASDWANRPVNYVSFWDACRFANWLSNGQGNGSTETGTYTLNGYNGIDGRTIRRNTKWKWAVTSEDEWYKAAYYKGGGTNAGYWDYPCKSDNTRGVGNQVLSTDPGNSYNFLTNSYSIGSPYYRTNVGEFENTASAYGTFDQGGNVWEWNEAVFSGASSGLRGGSFEDPGGNYLHSSFREYKYLSYPTNESHVIGFRVSQFVSQP